MTTKWFEADKNGLNKQAKERGPEYIFIELISNAIDERFSGVNEVKITATPVPYKSLVEVCVEDNSPRGYGEYLHHSYTLFAESYKRSNPLQSGQFNFGCKLWLSLCREASIETTTGTVIFDDRGRHYNPRQKRSIGTKVKGIMEMSREEFEKLKVLLGQILIPKEVKVLFNNVPLVARSPFKTFETQLPTKIVDEEGVMKSTVRKTVVNLYEPLENEKPTIYEMAIPVVETDIRWHVQVFQKVILNKDRDNVSPAYHQKLRTAVAENSLDLLNSQDANSWCNDVLADSSSTKEVRKTIVENKFGKKAASFDPKDQEANIRWQAQFDGTIVHGRNLTKEQWENIKEFELLKPAGKLSPTPKPWSDDPDAKPADFVDPADWTDGMKNIAGYIEYLAKEALGINKMIVRFAKQMGTSACYGRRGPSSGIMEFNMSSLGYDWFDSVTVEVDSLIIHEFAHHFISSHHNREFSDAVPSGMYYDACCYVGAKIKNLLTRDSAKFLSFINRS